MDIHELSRDQLVQLKQTMIVEWSCAEDCGVSLEELADADDTVSDGQVMERYTGTCFVPEDFY